MKTHPATEPGRPSGPAPGLRLLPRAVWLIAAFASLCLAVGVNAQQTPNVVISQVIATEDNSTYFDHNGDTPAVIILKNNGTAAGNISGWGLTDNPAVPLKWVFPSGVVPISIAPGETMAVFASALNRITPPYATNFLLPCGSTAYLYNQQASLISQKAVFGSLCPECIDLIGANSTAAWLVPSANNPAGTAGDWRLSSFNDSSWSRGQPCLGYEFDSINANMILYSTFDTVDVSTTNRTIADVSGLAVFHTGSWPNIVPQPIGIPITSPTVSGQSVQFAGPSNANSYVFYAHNAELNPGTASYTFSIWARPANTDNQSGECIFRKGGTATTDPGYSLSRIARSEERRVGKECCR